MKCVRSNNLNFLKFKGLNHQVVKTEVLYKFEFVADSISFLEIGKKNIIFNLFVNKER